MVRIISIFIVFIGFFSSSSGVNFQIQIGTWWDYSEFVEEYRDHETFDGWTPEEKSEVIAGLVWYENNCLDENLELPTKKNSAWSTPTSNSIPIYTAQVQNTTWWAPITIEIEVVGLDDWFEVMFASKLINSNISVRVLYWQENAYTQGYAEYWGKLIGNATDNAFGSISVAPVADYSGQFPFQVSGGGKLKLPPSNETRIIKLCITERPNADVLVPVYLSNNNVNVKVYANYYW